MDCCRPAHCHCDWSAPARSATTPLPARAATVRGHESAKNASVSGITVFPARGELLRAGSTDWVDAPRPAVAASYLSTHAFLI